MRWLGIGGVLVAACGAKAPPPVAERAHTDSSLTEVMTEEPVMSRTLLQARPRPAIDIAPYLPDFHNELRWPLKAMTHPTLEPQFAVAAALAAPGVDWRQLCARGAQHRHSATQGEMLQYLRGWCYAANRDVDGACRELVPLLRSGTAGLPAAVRGDLANILVDHGDASRAQHWLTEYTIRDPGLLDILAATYVDLDREADGFEINRVVLGFNDQPSAATQCHRQVRRYLLGQQADKLEARFALQQLGGDATCTSLKNAILCAREHLCVAYLQDQGIDIKAQSLISAYEQWPDGKADWTRWRGIASLAEKAIPMPGADELAIVALEVTLKAHEDRCDYGIDVEVNLVADLLRANKMPIDARLTKLLDVCNAAVVKP